MKRIALPLLLLLFTGPNLEAGFRIMAGFSLSRYHETPHKPGTNWRPKFGLIGGIGFEKDLTQKILIEFDVFFLQKGTRLESSTQDFTGDAGYSMNVVSLPLLFRVKPFYDSSPFLVLGGELSTVLDHTMTVDGALEPLDLQDQTPRLDYGLVFGGGLELKITDALYVFIESRYHWGKRNILGLVAGGDTSWKTQALVIFIGVRS